MKKLNKKQKDHIKNILKKTLNIFCYICTGILAIILLIVCLQGCQNKPQKVSAESYNSNNKYHYTLINDGEDGSYINLNKQNSILSYYNLPSVNVEDFSSEGTYQTFNVLVDTNTQVVYQNDYEYVKSFNYRFRVCGQNDTTELYWRLYDINVNLQNGTSRSVLEKASNFYNDYYYDIYNSAIDYVSSLTFYQVGGNEYLFDYYELASFTFNKDFNYNAPFYIDRSLPSSPVPPYDMPVNQTYMEYDTGNFVSNGQLFDKIRWNIRNNSGQEFYILTGDGDVISSHDYHGFTWVSLQYINSNTNTIVDVCSRTTGIALLDGAYVTFYQNNSLWVLDNYRHIVFLEPLNQDLIYALEMFNNNNQYSYGGTVVSGDINNIFTLIASAFMAWLPIMNMYLLPGITIGTLLFIPLVAMLVFAIIRIIKK